MIKGHKKKRTCLGKGFRESGGRRRRREDEAESGQNALYTPMKISNG